MSGDVYMIQIGTGKYSDIFAVHSKIGNMAMKVSFYTEETIDNFISRKKSGDFEGARLEKEQDSIIVSSNFSNVTSILLKRNITPHFVKIFAEQDVKNFAAKIPGLHKRLETLTYYQKIYNHVTFMDLFEMDMTEFLTKHILSDNVIRNIIFQIIYTLAAMQKILPGFRHNDLSTNNVLIKRMSNLSMYKVSDMTFYTNSNFFVAITDYDFVHCPGIKKLTNRRVFSGSYKVNEETNASYDVHLFLKSVLKCLTKIKPDIKLDSTHFFLKDLNLLTDDRHPLEIERLIPDNLLKHSYFDILKTTPSEEIYSKYSF